MKAYITRDSVHAGDDATAPHIRRCRISDDWSWMELVDQVWRASQLPSEIAGGKATWVLASGVPLAVAAQQWSKPEILPQLDAQRELLDIVGGEIRFHWSYWKQVEPSLAVDLLQHLKLRAEV